MTTARALIYSIANLCLIFLGVFIAFKVTWTKGPEAFLAIVAFVLVFGCSGALAIALTKLIVPTNPSFDENNWKTFVKNEGKVKAGLIVFTCLSFFLTACSGAVYLYLVSVKKYEHYQLSNFGQTQKVLIKDIRYKGKGTPLAFFDYQAKGNLYTNDLAPKQFNIGDSALIIFSKENPDIVKWADEFDK